MYTILGAGLSGISVADLLNKNNISFTIFEGKSHGGGHIHSEKVNEFTWDEGPHVSFTKSEYVKKYFADNCNNEYLEFSAIPSNYFKGNWVPHPAQANMYAIPEPLRTDCIVDVEKIRTELGATFTAQNYQQWINYAFGRTFAENFPEAYTSKYWTTKPENLTTDWIGKRVYFPEVSDMVESAKGPLQKQTHYLTQFRYPRTGGFYSFIKAVEKALPIRYNKKLQYISFNKKQLHFTDGEIISYDKLISTIPLPEMIRNSDAPDDVKRHAATLKCSQVLIINVTVSHATPIQNHWIYVYDRELYSTRINFTELLSPSNGVPGKTGIQVEVYFSEYRPLKEPIEEIEKKVLKELVTMRLAQSEEAIEAYHSKWINWANVIFDVNKIKAQNAVFNWLETKGMKREADDLLPMTDWDTKMNEEVQLGDIILAGRFAQWKYYWTDDCVLRGLKISKTLKAEKLP